MLLLGSRTPPPGKIFVSVPHVKCTLNTEVHSRLPQDRRREFLDSESHSGRLNPGAHPDHTG